MARGDGSMFAASDDSPLLKQIQATHAPDDDDNKDVRPVIEIVKSVFKHAAPIIQGTYIQSLEYKTGGDVMDSNGMLKEFAVIIQRVSREVAIALAALAMTYSEFGLVVQLFTTHPLAKFTAIIKQLPDLVEHSITLKPRFDAINRLFGVILDVTERIMEFKQQPRQYISPDNPPLSVAMTHIPTAVYWTIRSVLACANQFARLISMRSDENAASDVEVWELSNLAHKARNIHELLTQQLMLCYEHIGEKNDEAAYNSLVRVFELPPHVDIITLLRHLICKKDDIMPLLEGSTKSKVHVEALEGKSVLLLISDLEIPQEELTVLEAIYRDSRNKPEYEIVWIPIVDKSVPWTEEQQHKFEQLQSLMPWYTLHDPKIMEPAAIRYIKEVWKFAKRTILVVLDPQGNVACPNAFHMFFIWGNMAFPFTARKEEVLWRDETWCLEFFLDGIDPNILNWISQGKYICVYGGEDIEWIRRFTATAKRIAQAAEIDLEMVYVGKSNAKERMKKITAIINNENLSHFWPDITSMWYFWTRLECILYSKMQQEKSVENDVIMQEVMTLLSFDGSDQSWATMWSKPTEMARAKGDTILESLGMFQEWKENAGIKGFVPALRDHLQQLHTPHHCNRIILSQVKGQIPEKVECAECGRQMEKHFMYRCCTD
ncbi:Protein SIEVE ELEMENT OCCLUSION B [Bienertia sinuspersici]